MTIENFRPRHEPRGEVTKEGLLDVVHEHRPDLTDEQIDRTWIMFSAMRCRINYPARRNGSLCVRIAGSATIVPDPLPL